MEAALEKAEFRLEFEQRRVKQIMEARAEVAAAKEEVQLAQEERMAVQIALCRSDYELEQSERRLAALDFAEEVVPDSPDSMGEPAVGIPVAEGVLV